jgi:outer membrane protein TolC
MKQFLLAILGFFIFQAHGQQVRALSMTDAVNLGLNNAIDLKNLVLDEEIQVAQNKEITASALPQITASGQLTYYTNLPKIPFPSSDIAIYQVLEKEKVKDGNGNIVNPANATFQFNSVSFVAPLNYQIGIGVQQLLFQPDVFVALKARQTILEMAKANTTLAKDKVKESVQKAYYAVLVAQNQKTLIDANMSRLEKLHYEMGQMYKNGFVEKLDIDKLSVAINNTKSAQNQLNNGIAISQSVLKNALGISQNDSLVLTDQLSLEELQTVVMKMDEPFDYNNRHELQSLSIAKKLQELDMKRYKMGYLPTVAAFYQLQKSGQRNEAYSFNGSSPWFSFNTGLVGLSINQPIFDGFQKKYKIQQIKLQMDKIDNSSQQLKQYFDLENSIAKSSLRNAVLNLDVQLRNMKLAESVFNTTTKKFQGGLGSSLDVIQTDTELQRANGSFFVALYDAYIAKVNYQKSIGKL